MRSCANCRPYWRPGPACAPSAAPGSTPTREPRPNEALLVPLPATYALEDNSGLLVRDLETDDTADDAEQQKHPQRRHRLLSRPHGVARSQGSADAHPDRVGRTEREAAHRVGQTGHAGDE